jgi:predicted metal-dependent hydrolase
VLDWLRRDPREPHAVEVGGRTLPVVVRRLSRARRMTLRLSPDGGEVRISMPDWGRTADALAFAESRREWLAKQVAALPQAEPLAAGAKFPFRGEPLVIAHSPGWPRKPVLQDGAIRLGGPTESLAQRLKRWLEGEARALLAADIADYCGRAGRPPAKLALSGANRRWGSCSPSGSIRINWRLVMAPDEVRRSVVAHEVAHLVHFDHSPRFHAILEELFEGDLKAANAWLKREGRALYLPFG